MLEISYRYACLWICKIIGLIRRIIARKLILNFSSLLLISATLWCVDHRAEITTALETTIHAAYEQIYTDLIEVYKKLNPSFKSESRLNAVPQIKVDGSPNRVNAQTESKPLLTFMNVLSIWALGLIIFWINQARRTLVIGQFDDLSGGKSKINNNGFGILLSLEISNLSDLFSEFEKGNEGIPTVPQALKPVNASIQTETVSQFVEKAVTTETNFQLGPFKIPLGIVLGLVGKMVRGPRITGQIHMAGDKSIVTAEIIGSLGRHIWKVEEQTDTDKQRDIVYDLACMIFSYLAFENTVSWQGLKHYAAALTAYRRSIKTKISWTLNLKSAEQELLKTVAEDPDFDLAYYNLGVIYSKLDQLDAAEVAFDKSISINNRRWSAYYARGITHYSRGLKIQIDNDLGSLPVIDKQRVMTEAGQHYLKAIDNCDQASILAPSMFIKAKALNQKALCYLNRGEMNKAGYAARQAYIAAWRSLCSYESKRLCNSVEQKILHEQTYSFVSLCIWNLSQHVKIAIKTPDKYEIPKTKEGLPDLNATAEHLEKNSWLEKLIWRKTIKFLTLARMLTPRVADIHHNLGLAYLTCGDYKRALHTLNTCVCLDPYSVISWGYLAFAYAQYNRQNEVLNSVYQIIDNFKPTSPEMESLEYAIKALAKLNLANNQLDDFLNLAQSKKARIPSRVRRIIFAFFWFLPRFFNASYKMAGYSWLEIGVYSQYLRNLMRDPAQAKNVCEVNRNILQTVANRINSLFTFNQEINNLIEKKDIKTLNNRLQEQINLGFDWECGVIEDTLANYYYKQNAYKKAIKHIDSAIKYFKHSHPGEIQRRSLYSYRSRIMLSDRQYGEALNSAKIGISKQPIGAYERNSLGRSYFTLCDYVEAKNAWKDALYWDPNNSETHYNLGLAYFYQSLDSNIKDDRKQLLNKAAEYFTNAFELSSSKERRFDARYMIAKCHVYTACYTQAIIELRALEKMEKYHEVICLELAENLDSRGDYEDAENLFISTVETLEAALTEANGNVNQSVDFPSLSSVECLGIALSYAHLGIASTLLNRDIQVSVANQEIDKARAYLENLDNKDAKRLFQANCDVLKSKVELKQGEPRKAVEKLEAAVAANDDANTYYLLAMVLEQIIQQSSKAEEKWLLINRFKNYCTLAEKKDWNDELKIGLEQLRQKIA